MYNYTCFHIAGTDNVWADLLGSWSTTPVVRRLMKIPKLSSSADDDFVWRSISEIYSLQEDYHVARPETIVMTEDLWCTNTGAI